MSSERATKAYDHYKDLQQRAEYLVVGLLGASIAFFWQTGSPARLGVNPPTLHLFGLLFLFVALICALLRLHKLPYLFAMNGELLDMQDERATLVRSISHGTVAVSGTRGVMGASDQIAEAQRLGLEIEALQGVMDDSNKYSKRMFHLRNTSMGIGYAIFLGHRIWLPYFH